MLQWYSLNFINLLLESKCETHTCSGVNAYAKTQQNHDNTDHIVHIELDFLAEVMDVAEGMARPETIVTFLGFFGMQELIDSILCSFRHCFSLSHYGASDLS